MGFSNEEAEDPSSTYLTKYHTLLQFYYTYYNIARNAKTLLY